MTWYARCSVCDATERLESRLSSTSCHGKPRLIFEDKGAGWPAVTEHVVLRNLRAMLENVHPDGHLAYVERECGLKPSMFPDVWDAYDRVIARAKKCRHEIPYRCSGSDSCVTRAVAEEIKALETPA